MKQSVSKRITGVLGVDKRITINDLIAHHYEELSPQLKIAADHVMGHLDDVASRSLRAVATGSKMNPPTFSRLAKALDLGSYEELRELCRHAIRARHISFADKASGLQSAIAQDDSGTRTPFALMQSAAAIRNIEKFANDLDLDRLRTAADGLVVAERVFVVGCLASAGFAQYFGYMANLAFTHWQVVGSNGISMTTALTDLTGADAVLVITMEPYAKRSIYAAQIACESGAFVIVISDSNSCPAYRFAGHSFTVPTDSPQFFSSYIATLALLESLMGMIIRRSGPDVRRRLEAVELNNHRLGEYWPVIDQS